MNKISICLFVNKAKRSLMEKKINLLSWVGKKIHNGFCLIGLLMIWNVLPINSSFSLMEIITLRVWQLTVNITYYFSTKSNTYAMEKSIAVNKPVFIPLSADILSSYRHLLSYWFMPRLHWIEISITRRPLQREYTASQWCIRHIAATKIGIPANAGTVRTYSF